MILEHDAAEHLAFLTLTRGVSAWGSWAFDAEDIGSSITVGAGSGCDWQIASPGVTPLTLLFTGDSLLSRCARPDDRVRLNGVPLKTSWVPLHDGDRIDLGAASIGVRMTPTAQRTKSRSRGERGRRSPRSKGDENKGDEKGGFGRVKRQSSQGGSALALIPQPKLKLDATLFDRGPEHKGVSPARLRRYAALGLLMALAYAGWLVLLDYL